MKVDPHCTFTGSLLGPVRPQGHHSGANHFSHWRQELVQHFPPSFLGLSTSSLPGFLARRQNLATGCLGALRNPLGRKDSIISYSLSPCPLGLFSRGLHR